MNSRIEILVEMSKCCVEFDSPSIGPGCGKFSPDMLPWSAKKGCIGWIRIGVCECGNPILDAALKLLTLTHETGHALCNIKGCNHCCQDTRLESRILGECHADTFAAQWLLDNVCVQAMCVLVAETEENAAGPPLDIDPYRQPAARMLLNSEPELWEKCKLMASLSSTLAWL